MSRSIQQSMVHDEPPITPSSKLIHGDLTMVNGYMMNSSGHQWIPNACFTSSSSSSSTYLVRSTLSFGSLTTTVLSLGGRSEIPTAGLNKLLESRECQGCREGVGLSFVGDSPSSPEDRSRSEPPLPATVGRRKRLLLIDGDLMMVGGGWRRLMIVIDIVNSDQ